MRGAAYCRSAMRAAPAQLADFKRDQARAFDYLSRKEIDEVVTVVRELAEQQDAMSEDAPGGSSDGASA